MARVPNLGLEHFETHGPVLTLEKARQSFGLAIIGFMEKKADGKCKTEDEARAHYLGFGIWVPGKRHWAMKSAAYFRDAAAGGRVRGIPLTTVVE